MFLPQVESFVDGKVDENATPGGALRAAAAALRSGAGRLVPRETLRALAGGDPHTPGGAPVARFAAWRAAKEGLPLDTSEKAGIRSAGRLACPAAAGRKVAAVFERHHARIAMEAARARAARRKRPPVRAAGRPLVARPRAVRRASKPQASASRIGPPSSSDGDPEPPPPRPSRAPSSGGAA